MYIFSACTVKTLEYLKGRTKPLNRLIVATKYLNDGRVAFIDRKNSVLLITNTDDESYNEIDLSDKIPVSANTGRASNDEIKPSDINKGFDDDQFLITYTGKDFSLGVIYKITHNQQEMTLEHSLTVQVLDRTRSIVVVDKNRLCATTENQVVILDELGNKVASHRRSKRDRGGLLMSDGNGRFFYGDGDEYVGCKWNGRDIEEIFRFRNPAMKFPRGSVIDRLNRLVVCCDTSRNILRILPEGQQSEVISAGTGKAFGDIDFHPSFEYFVTTFWQENEWPMLFKVEA